MGEKSRGVKTNPLVNQFWVGRMAVCGCDTATGKRMENVMPIGPRSSPVERRGPRHRVVEWASIPPEVAPSGFKSPYTSDERLMN
jgi:hypothetical protein